MNRTLTTVLALAGLAAAAGAAQGEPTLLSSTQMDAVTAGTLTGNTALADAMADATALGQNTLTYTLTTTSTTVVQGVGSESSSTSRSESTATP